MSDPTLEILEAVRDPDRYVRVSGVPVFVPHVRHGEDEDGGEVVEAEVDEAELERIAHIARKKIAEKGILIRITPGHVRLRKPGEPPPDEKDQPPAWGWGANPRVGTWGPEKTPGLLLDCYFRKDRYDDLDGGVLSYPYRSAEYYPPTHEITGVALLRRDPELDLGLLTYARQDTPEARMPLDDEDDLDLEPEDEGGEGGDDEYSPEEVEQYGRMLRYMHQHAASRLEGLDPEHEDYPALQQHARLYERLAYEGEPAGGNTYVPGDDLDGGDDLDEPPLDPIGGEPDDEEDAPLLHGRQGRQYGRERTPARKPRREASRREPSLQQLQYERKVRDLEAKARQLEAKAQRLEAQAKHREEMVQYERNLLRLQTAGVEFDIDEELKDAEDMSPKERGRQLKRIQRQYGRSPVGGGLIDTGIDDPAETGRRKQFTARHKQAALQHRQKTGCSWDQAMAWALENI